jgi:hypothetical protein
MSAKSPRSKDVCALADWCGPRRNTSLLRAWDHFGVLRTSWAPVIRSLSKRGLHQGATGVSKIERDT